MVAHADGRAEVNEYDAMLLEHVFGNRPDDSAKVREGGPWSHACVRVCLACVFICRVLRWILLQTHQRKYTRNTHT